MSPIAWINDDMPALGAGTSWETVLADAAAIGFTGVELGGSFPREGSCIQSAFAAHRLAVVGQWYGCALLERGVAAEIDALAPQLALLEAVGASVLIVAETSNAVHRDRACPLSASPRLGPDDWARWGERLTGLADHVAARGLRLAYHPHLGTIIEREEGVARLVAATGTSVGLTLDTGHAALAEIDPAGLARDYPDRIAHVHCKDIRRDRFASLRARGGSFLDGVLEGIFAVPGDGSLDFTDLMQALATGGYDGWIVVEAEQDPRVADPRLHATRGLATVRAAARAAGLVDTAR